MPLIRTLWDYLPFTSYIIQPSVDGTDLAAMSASNASANTVEGHAPAVNAFAGTRQGMFGRDFYDRIHFSSIAVSLGNLVGSQERTLTIWNAYRRARVLYSLNLIDGEGITLSGQADPPLAFAPLQERTYTLSVSTNGPPVINATIEFQFDGGETVSVSVTGTRITAWTWPPDWQAGMIERLLWRTDVLQAYRGEEQRRALRLGPRQEIEFTVAPHGAERRHLEAALWNWGARIWAVPLWYDGQDLAATLPVGSTSIPLDPDLRDFQPGTLALLLGDSSRSYEVVEVASLTGSSIELARPTESAWPAGTRVYPARPARIDGNASLPRFTGTAASARLRFEMADPATWAADAGAATHRGFPVLELRPNWVEEPDMVMERKVTVIDANTGPVVVDDEAQMPLTTQRLRWLFDGRAEIDAWRKRLFAMRGRHASMWVPTWSEDLVPVATLASSGTQIDVSWCAYTQYQAVQINRRDLRIELANGQVFYRRVTGSVELDANTERLSIDAALGVTVTADEFALVSFMALGRFDSDSHELAWWTGDHVEAAATLRTFRRDV